MLTFHSTQEIAMTKAAQRRTWDAFLAGGTGHSASASTLPYILRRCEQEKIPYLLKAVPGHGYWIEPDKHTPEDPQEQYERRAKREADQAQVQGEIVVALAALGKATQPFDVAKAIMAGRIPHVKVET